MRLVIALIALLSASHAAAQQPGVVLRSRLDPQGEAVIGQPINLYVDVLFPDTMPRPPRVAVRDIAGAQVLRFETQGVTIRDSIDGKAYVGQEFAFVVIARRAGELALPGAEVTLLDVHGTVAGSARGDATTIRITAPQGVDASGPVIASSMVRATQSWSPAPTSHFAPGGALTRVVTREAADVPALGMADFAFTAPEGVRVYLDAPLSDDRVNRGSVTGHRIDKATYVFERGGRFAIPALAQPWYDLATRQARSEALPGVAVEVMARPAPAKQAPEEMGAKAIWRPIAEGLVLALFVLALWPLIRTALRRRASPIHASLRHLRETARSGDAAETYRALLAWRAATPQAVETERSLSGLVQTLESALFGTAGAWTRADGEVLADRLGHAAAAANRHASSAGRLALPALNPASPETMKVSKPLAQR